MKKDILKIAGVKSEKEFYKKFPSEEAFMKVHGKAFKKAAMGASMVKKQLTQLTDFSNPPQAEVGAYIGGEQSSYKPVNYTDLQDQSNYATTGVNRQMRMDQDNIEAQQMQAKNAGKGGLDIGNLMQGVGNIAQLAESLRQGGYIPRAQDGLISMPDFTKADKTMNRQFKFENSKFNQGMQKFGKGVGQGYDKLDSSLGKVGGVSGAMGIGTDLIEGFQQLKQEKDIQRGAHQFHELSGLTKQVAGLQPDIAARKYVRPEDMAFGTQEMGQSYGAGTNYLAKNGMQVGGNLTEIQNMYNPGDIYSDMGYEPLSDSEIVKQYRKGGLIPKAQFGMDQMAGQAGGALGSLIGGGKGRPTAGGKIGSTIGSTVGKFIPIPGASAVLGAVGGIVGGIAGGKSAKKTEAWQTGSEQNIQDAAFMSGAQGLRNQFSNVMEDGGWVSNDWQPQVITQFGGYDMKDLLKDDPTMDTLRAGGHIAQAGYTAPSARAMQTYAMGGELQTHWGGEAEPISYNPYLPGDGETVMFRGQSHDESDGQGRTGIGVTYGDNPVEVERGEPAVKLQDGGEEESLVVYGNMKIPSYGVSELGDIKAKGKKFKNYANDLSKKEAKNNKTIEKGLKLIESADENNPFDLLKLNSGQAMLIGANEQLKGLAIQKQRLAGIQNAILETAEEQGLESDALAKGKIKKAKNSDMAKFGGKFTQAQVGIKQPSEWFPSKDAMLRGMNFDPSKGYTVLDYIKALPEVVVQGKKAAASNKSTASNKQSATSPSAETSVATSTPYTSSLDSRWDKYLPEKAPNIPIPYSSLEASKKAKGVAKVADKIISSTEGGKKKDKFGIEDILRQVQPYLLPSNQQDLDPNQLTPEMYALAMNQLEPVQAQTFQPLLEQPYSVSLQDQLNANQADFNALQRQMGYNPSAASSLAAQKYAANSAILGQQARINQEMQMGAFNRNRGVLNDATLKNLSILDQQYQRQSQAKSNTKAQAQAALSSIADKIAKNKLENRTLGVYENMYNYRFGPKGRAINVNAPVDWSMQGSPFARTSGGKGQLAPEMEFTYDANQNIIGTRKSSKENPTGKNGAIVKALKNL